MKSADHPARSAPPISPRRRKLRIALSFVSLTILAVASVAALVAWKNRPSHYAPGETSAEVTSELSKKLPPDAPKPKLTDVTTAAGLSGFRNFAGQRTSQIPEDMGPGLAWGDFDNDGDDDLFLVSAGGALNVPESQLLPCALYENLGDGRFRKSDAFPEVRLHGMGAAWGDYDGDGFLDLVISGYNKLLLFHNVPGSATGSRKFVRVASFPDPKGFWAGVSWGDYNNDRRLDLYVCGYIRYIENEEDRGKGSDQLGTFVPYTLNPASYEPGINLLLRNNGDGTFTDVAAELGVTNPTGRSLSALWHDFDDDGWLDLYVANDVSDNVFYRNTGGKFEDISHPAWVADYRSAMGLAAGDYDRDGDDDLFITHWVAQENALYENQWADFHGKSHTNSASLLRFTDVNEMRGLGQVALPFVGWGTQFGDFDGDGWLDLIVANGNTLEEQGSTPKKLIAQESFLFWNQRGQFFYDLAPLNRPLSEKHSSRGLAVADYDNDGDLDVALAQLGEGVQLLRNEMQAGHWLEMRLRSRNAAGQPIGFGDGAKVLVTAGGVTHRRTVSSASYLSQSSHTLHVGLGSDTNIAKVEVRWLGGETNVYTNVQADGKWVLVEGAVQAERMLPATRAPADERSKLAQFWSLQRAAMDAVKIEKDRAKAIQLFRAALELNPRHEDSHYYLAQSLAAEGQFQEALAELKALQQINPQSHRAFQQWGNLRALFATTPQHLLEAEAALEQAHALNPEETGALLLAGEVSLLAGDYEKAEGRLTAACRTNPRAATGFFLRSYLAYRKGDRSTSVALLAETRKALGPEWQPKGTTAEGDVKAKQHVETSPLQPFCAGWNGSDDPETAFAALKRFLDAKKPIRVKKA